MSAATKIRRGSASLSDDITPDIVGHHIEWGISALDHRLVERAQVVGIAQRRFRTDPLAHDFGVADLVSARLARPAAIAVDFALDLGAFVAVALHEKADGLLAAPALAEARVLDVHDYRTVFGARGLNALLAWPGLDAAEVVNARFQVKRGSDEYDRAVASGVLFEESSEVARAQVFLSSRRRGRAEVQDVSVTLDGRLSREWLNTYRHDH